MAFREKQTITWIVALVALTILLNLPLGVSRRIKTAVREALAPLQELVSDASLKSGEAVRTIRGLRGVIQRNHELEEELARLRQQMRLLQDSERQNAQLREQLGFYRRAQRPIEPCEIIARDVSGWWQSVRLNKGSSDGLAPDLAVMTTDGLVGRTQHVSSHTCDVLLISDPNSRVAVQVLRTGANGVLTGQGTRPSGAVVCRLDFINRNFAPRPGDEVVTSGLGGVFPPGLLVGYIEESEADKTGLYQQATVIPKADLGRMTYVFVLLGEGAGDVRSPAEPAESEASETPAALPPSTSNLEPRAENPTWRDRVAGGGWPSGRRLFQMPDGTKHETRQSSLSSCSYSYSNGTRTKDENEDERTIGLGVSEEAIRNPQSAIRYSISGGAS